MMHYCLGGGAGKKRQLVPIPVGLLIHYGLDPVRVSAGVKGKKGLL